eukprot:gnl/Ergobibamus_cyprinoides/4997.p2 GENE.gnl/Ergobibamus_cyprinoides/4997~~gnl/Ergobibamus_cyprinoides/4997.p2  ORF type:complete len:192 (+),score=29.91 gnl/Ergobibamus_cyprinoides/4997:30-578(+)
MPETVSFGPALAEAADAERLPDVCLPQHCAAFSTADALAVSLPSDMALALDMACADGVVEIPVYVDRARGFAVVTCAPVRETEDILLAGHVRGPRVALGAAQVLLRQEPPVSPRARPPPTYSLVVWGEPRGRRAPAAAGRAAVRRQGRAGCVVAACAAVPRSGGHRRVAAPAGGARGRLPGP